MPPICQYDDENWPSAQDATQSENKAWHSRTTRPSFAQPLLQSWRLPWNSFHNTSRYHSRNLSNWTYHSCSIWSLSTELHAFNVSEKSQIKWHLLTQRYLHINQKPGIVHMGGGFFSSEHVLCWLLPLGSQRIAGSTSILHSHHYIHYIPNESCSFHFRISFRQENPLQLRPKVSLSAS